MHLFLPCEGGGGHTDLPPLVASLPRISPRNPLTAIFDSSGPAPFLYCDLYISLMKYNNQFPVDGEDSKKFPILIHCCLER